MREIEKTWRISKEKRPHATMLMKGFAEMALEAENILSNPFLTWVCFDIWISHSWSM